MSNNNTDNKANPVFSMDTIQQAAAAIRGFKPLSLELKSGTFDIVKLPSAALDQVIANFGATINNLIQQSQQQAEPMEWPEIINMVVEQLPGLRDALVADGTTVGDTALDYDEKLLLAGAVICINFIDNQAIKVFFEAAVNAAQRDLSEIDNEVSSKPADAEQN